jgi:hypothetical protein
MKAFMQRKRSEGKKREKFTEMEVKLNRDSFPLSVLSLGGQ